MKITKNELLGKLIDVHSHIGISITNVFDDKYPYCFSSIELSTYLKNIKFDAACVFPFPSYICGNNIQLSKEEIEKIRLIFEPIPYKKETEQILTEIERFKLFNLLPFSMFSLNYAIDEQLSFLEKISSKIYGLKYYPDADQVKISELYEKGKVFLNYLVKYNIPLIIHVSENACLYAKGYSNVMDAIELAKKMPELRIAVAHMGHFSKKALSYAKILELPNLYFDLSPLLHICHIRTINKGDVLDLNYNKPEEVIKELINMFPKHLLWGTDMPFNFTCNLKNDNHNFDYQMFSIDSNISILNKLSEDIVKKICSDNVLNFLFGE